MRVTLASYIESLSNPAGRFATMVGAYPVKDSTGRPVFSSGSRTVTFRVVWKEKRYLMRCPLSADTALRAHAEKYALESLYKNNPYIVPCDYRRGELLIFDRSGNSYRVDIILEEEPPGEALAQFVRSRLFISGRRHFRELLCAIADMAATTSSSGMIHGHLHPDNIFIGENNTPLAVNYALPTERTEEGDGLWLSLIAANIFLLACEPKAYRLSGERQMFSGEAFRSNLPHFITQSQFLRLHTLTGLLDMHRAPAGISRTEINYALRSLAETPFTPMPLMAELLAGNQGGISISEHAVPEVIPSPPFEDITLMIDLRRCDETGPLSDTLIRFRLKNKWDYSDRYGRRVTSEGFRDARDFYEGRAAVETDSGWGIIDRAGKYILQPRFEMLEWNGSDNVAAACADGKWELYDRDGRQLTTGRYDWMGECSDGILLAKRGNKFGYLLPDGSHLTDMRYDDAYSFSDGKARVAIGVENFMIDRRGFKIS